MNHLIAELVCPFVSDRHAFRCVSKEFYEIEKNALIEEITVESVYDLFQAQKAKKVIVDGIFEQLYLPMCTSLHLIRSRTINFIAPKLRTLKITDSWAFAAVLLHQRLPPFLDTLDTSECTVHLGFLRFTLHPQIKHVKCKFCDPFTKDEFVSLQIDGYCDECGYIRYEEAGDNILHLSQSNVFIDTKTKLSKQLESYCVHNSTFQNSPRLPKGLKTLKWTNCNAICDDFQDIDCPNLKILDISDNATLYDMPPTLICSGLQTLKLIHTSILRQPGLILSYFPNVTSFSVDLRSKQDILDLAQLLHSRKCETVELCTNISIELNDVLLQIIGLDKHVSKFVIHEGSPFQMMWPVRLFQESLPKSLILFAYCKCAVF